MPAEAYLLRIFARAAAYSSAPATEWPTYVDTGKTSTPMTTGTLGLLVIVTVMFPLLLKLAPVVVPLLLFDE